MIRSKKIRNIFLIFVALRVVVYWFFAGRGISPFGPDEGTYASFLQWDLEGHSHSSFPNYGPDFYPKNVTFLWPSLTVTRIFHLSPLLSVRAVSGVFSILCAYLFCWVIQFIEIPTPKLGNKAKWLSVRNSRLTDEISKGRNSFNFVIGVVCVFIPSIFIWGTLGLKDTTVLFFFSTFTFSYVLFLYSYRIKRPSQFPIILGLISALSLFALFFIRAPLAQVATISVILHQIIQAIIERKYVLKHLTIGLISILLFLLGGNLNTNGATPHRNSILDLASTVSSSEMHQSNLAKGAKSEITPIHIPVITDNCVTTNSKENGIIRNLCKISNIPWTLFSILIRPVPFIEKGSNFAFYASIENLIWYFLYFIFLKNFRKRIKLKFTNLRSSYAFILLMTGIFLLSSSIFEGNVGTAFRHKIILLPILLISNFNFDNLEKYRRSKAVA